MASTETPNNAALDDGEASDLVNQSFDSDCSKENQIPKAWCEAPPKPVKSQTKRDIDAEIAEVEKEMGRLWAKLETLRLDKAARTRSIAIRGRIVPAKFMESQKQTASNSRTTQRRGLSLGPGEIFSASKKSSESVTPLQSALNRRKSCFFKLPGIEEAKETKSRVRTSMSLSPRSRKAASKITVAQKQAATTVGGLKRAVKKDDGVLSSIQPKRLFKEEEKNIAVRKPARVVPSRYTLSTKTQTAEKDARKRSLPENQEKENHRSEKRRASDENSKSEGRAKKRWEIPSEVDLYTSGVILGDETPIGKGLPKITTLRRAVETPRDSGAAKRVAELETKSRNFTFCQLLRFEE